jgi:hypothetical protein
MDRRQFLTDSLKIAVLRNALRATFWQEGAS